MKISNGGSGLPSRVILHGVEGVGKTSLGAYAPKPIYLMTRGETGLLTLIDNGRVPPTDHFEECETWGQVLAAIRYLIDNQTPHRTLVIDTLNGAERLCFENVCLGHYDGNWQSFASYGRGPDVSQSEWSEFLTLLDHLRSHRRMAILTLCHTKIKPYNNPLGDNFDRFSPDMNDKTWGGAAKWADIILFGNFEIQVKKENKQSKGKGVGGERRMLYTTRTAAFDAKNRTGLPPQISMGPSAESAWKALAAALARSRQTTAKEQPLPPPSPSSAVPLPADSANGNGKASAVLVGNIHAVMNQIHLPFPKRERLLHQLGVHNWDELSEDAALQLLDDLRHQAQLGREPGIDEEEEEQPEPASEAE